MIIALCGFMTSGKTLAGEALSKKTGKRLIDLDQYIEQKEGLKMEDIFKEKGEPYFRKKEEECLKQIVEKEDDIILSLGGGTPMNPNCSAVLKEKTRCIFLTCSPKVLAARMLLLQDGRPLVKNLLANHKSSTPEEKLQILEQWAKEKLQEREPIYKACSVKTVDTSGWDIEKILKQILRG
ncbi:MAG: shikimate kinase [Bacteroidales bacterium]|nr:shikimate kinase [Bacteroidales bacterium]